LVEDVNMPNNLYKQIINWYLYMILKIMFYFLLEYIVNVNFLLTFVFSLKSDGVVAQLVEQRTENPCVDGSIPFDTTAKKPC
jgi:hypothetical protein